VDGSLTVAQLLDQWAEKGLPSRNLQPATLAVHEWACKIITEDIGSRRVRALSPLDVESMFRRRADDGLSKASLSKLRSTLRIALQWAERREMVARNVARVSELPADARPATARKSMTADQLRALLTAAEGTPLEAMWLTMVTLGLRPGEAAALSWEDVDKVNNIVHVRRALKRGKSGALYLGPLKTIQSARSLDAPASVIEALQRRRHEQKLDQIAAGRFWSNAEDLVWTNSVGSLTDPARNRRAFEEAVRAADIGTGWSPNSLRHTAASLLCDAGVALEEVADQLGHKDTRMASLHYRHRVRPTISGAFVMAGVINPAE
jgi:integrase